MPRWADGPGGRHQRLRVFGQPRQREPPGAAERVSVVPVHRPSTTTRRSKPPARATNGLGGTAKPERMRAVFTAYMDGQGINDVMAVTGASRGSKMNTTTWVYNQERGWMTNKVYSDGNGPRYTFTAGEVHCKENGFLLGNGLIDFRKVRGALGDIGYRDWLIIEGATSQGLSLEDSYVHNQKYL